MKKKRIQKKLKIFSQSLAILLFSLMPFKVKAVNMTLNVSYLGQWTVNYQMVTGVGACVYTNTGTSGYVTASGQCSPEVYLPPSGLSGKAWNKEYIMEIQYFIYEGREQQSNGYINNTPVLQINHNGGVFYGSYIGSDIQQATIGSTVISMYFKLDNGIEGTQYFNSSSSMRLTPYVGMFTGETSAMGSKVGVFASSGENNNQDIINSINQLKIDNNNWLSQINQNIQEVRQAIIDSQGAVNNINNTINNSIDETQQASDEGTANAEQSQTDNETASQNIIGVVGNIVQVFYTPAGNCNIDVDLGNLDLGNLNFCSGKPREFEQIINLAGSILIVYACYRVARTIFRIWLTLSIFGQGGNTKGDK